MYPDFGSRARLMFKRNFTITNNLKEFTDARNNNINPPLYVNATANAKTYDNFWDCYQNLNNLELKQLSQNPKYERKVKQITDSFEQFARKFENELSCNGICYPGLFFYFSKLN